MNVYQRSAVFYAVYVISYMPPNTRTDFPSVQILTKSPIKAHLQGAQIFATLPGMITQYLGKNAAIIEEFRFKF